MRLVITVPALNVRPDENYAREVLQLFSTGLNLLQVNGEPVMQGGLPVPAYTQVDIEEFARVFTGWNYATAPIAYTTTGDQ